MLDVAMPIHAVYTVGLHSGSLVVRPDSCFQRTTEPGFKGTRKFMEKWGRWYDACGLEDYGDGLGGRRGQDAREAQA